MNPEHKSLAIELLLEAQKDLDLHFDSSDFEKLLSVDAASDDRREKLFRQTLNEIIG